MKKVFIIFLSLLLTFPSISLAKVDVLAGNCWNASLEELLAARNQIDNQILALGGELPNQASPTPTFTPTTTPIPTSSPSSAPLLFEASVTASPLIDAAMFRELTIGCNGQDVLDAKCRLEELGYPISEHTDPYYSRDFAYNVQYFESDCGLIPDGKLSPEDQMLLFSIDAPIEFTMPAPKNVTVKPLESKTDINGKFYASTMATWDIEADADQYNIYRSTERNGTYDLIGYAYDTWYLDKGIQDPATYYYKIEAIRGTYTSEMSAASNAVSIDYPEIPNPLRITDVKISFNSINTPEVYLSVENTSSNTIVDAFTFETKCYDAYGNLLQAHGFGDTISSWIWQEGLIKENSKWASSSWHWTLYGYETAYRIEIYLTSVHTSNGQTITIPLDNSIIWTWNKH